MSDKLTRREFLKIAAVGTATASVLTGCGTAARYVTRKPYQDMPEYTLPGRSTFYATTCRECPAACGLIVRTVEGRAVKVEGNPNHPVNHGRTCSRGQATLQGLYNPDRLDGPISQSGGSPASPMTWDAAVEIVKGALISGGFTFLLGQTPHHLTDLISEISTAFGAPPPLNYGALGMFEGRATLLQAATALFGLPILPQFDLANADVILSFGANFLETWQSPVAYTRDYATMRGGKSGQRGYLIQFEPRMSLTAANADEWIPVAPGTEGLVAQALGKLVAEQMGSPVPAAFASADVAAAAQASGVAETELRRLARVFANSPRKLALPGGGALGHTNGLEAAQAILFLNVLAGNVDQPGGMSFQPLAAYNQGAAAATAFTGMQELVGRMQRGELKALFIHGFNPVFELPKSLGFTEALANVPLVISFASFPDETVALADYVFPDHTPLESWGYQKIAVGSEQAALSGSQPVVVPLYDTKATADVLLAALQAAGDNSLIAKVPYTDEVDFLQKKLAPLASEDGFYTAVTPKGFWAKWLQFGGWWKTGPSTMPLFAVNDQPLAVGVPEFSGGGEFFLLPYPHPHLGDGSQANRPWLQETPDQTTTVMWGTWVAIHPETADRLGVTDDDVVRVASSTGEIEASVYRYPGIRLDAAAIPFGQGHTALGRFAEGRGANPLAVVDSKLNAAGDLAFGATKVTITPTGKKQKLARYESRVGVYGYDK